MRPFAPPAPLCSPRNAPPSPRRSGLRYGSFALWASLSRLPSAKHTRQALCFDCHRSYADRQAPSRCALRAPGRHPPRRRRQNGPQSSPIRRNHGFFPADTWTSSHEAAIDDSERTAKTGLVLLCVCVCVCCDEENDGARAHSVRSRKIKRTCWR
jgi:hypothetical protein